MTTRTLSWSALALIIVFGGVVVGDQVFASSGLDFLGIVFFGFLGLVLIVLSVAALFRLQAERYRALAPVVILVLGLWVGWPAALEVGAWGPTVATAEAPSLPTKKMSTTAKVDSSTSSSTIGTASRNTARRSGMRV